MQRKPPAPSAGQATTPDAGANPAVDAFCAALSPTAPIRLIYTDLGEGYLSRCCHASVRHRVRHHGGRRVNGWMIWQLKDRVEAEFHAVWLSPAGDLLDITPRVDGEVNILFVPDHIREIERLGTHDVLFRNPCTDDAGSIPPRRFLCVYDSKTRAELLRLGLGETVVD